MSLRLAVQCGERLQISYLGKWRTVMHHFYCVAALLTASFLLSCGKSSGPAVAPLSVSIVPPGTITAGAAATWTAQVNGGHGPYTAVWDFDSAATPATPQS